jgi:hypothetical protein
MAALVYANLIAVKKNFFINGEDKKKLNRRPLTTTK